MSKSFQAFAIQILSIDCKVSSLASESHEKVKITLQPFAPCDIPNQWGEEVLACLSKATSYIKTCWLKTITGAWCISVACIHMKVEAVFLGAWILLMSCVITRLVPFSGNLPGSPSEFRRHPLCSCVACVSFSLLC